jgi:hypothetical protein
MYLLDQVKDTFFNYKGIEIDPNREGLKFKEDGTLILGCMAGPSQEVNNLLHEMAHLIICPKANLWKTSWGLIYKNYVSIPGHPTFINALTCQDVILELSVIGWQAVLEKELTGSIDGALTNIEALCWLNGFVCYKYEETKEVPYPERDKAKFDLAKEQIREFASKVTYDDFLNKWTEKCLFIEQKYNALNLISA